jgi:hypothetical protein
MQAIDNLTRLRGAVLRRSPHPTRPGYELLTVQVDDAQPVEGRADLLGRHRGSALEVAVRAELLPGTPLPSGARVDLRAKMTPDGALAEPHPEAGHFRVGTGLD